MSKTTPQPPQLIAFSFPLFGFSCEATSQEEAQALLQSFINNQ
jgi:hypothetical protein